MWCWSWNSNILATSCKELTHWKRLWCWEGLRAGWKGDNRRWDDWMASPDQWTWVWLSSGSWWWTGRPGMLQSMGSHSWTQLSDWTKLKIYVHSCLIILVIHSCSGSVIRWLQLTLEQHGYELCGSPHTVLRNSRLVEFMDVDPQIWRSQAYGGTKNMEVICKFLTAWRASIPNPPIVQV